MEDRNAGSDKCITILRWTGRVWSLASVALLLAFIIGEGVAFSKFRPNELLMFLLFPVGISVGMILAWWKEGLGGAVTIGSLLAFYLVSLMTSGRFPKGWAWFVFAAPGLLFLLSFWLSRRSRPAAA
jgi:hypothetical protein